MRPLPGKENAQGNEDRFGIAVLEALERLELEAKRGGWTDVEFWAQFSRAVTSIYADDRAAALRRRR